MVSSALLTYFDVTLLRSLLVYAAYRYGRVLLFYEIDETHITKTFCTSFSSMFVSLRVKNVSFFTRYPHITIWADDANENNFFDPMIRVKVLPTFFFGEKNDFGHLYFCLFSDQVCALLQKNHYLLTSATIRGRKDFMILNI